MADPFTTALLMPTITFYFDPASPYTYLAATQIEAIAARHGASVDHRPVLVGKIFAATGNRMPAAVPAKGRYMMGDLQLWSRHYGVPIAFPKIFPVNSLQAQRIACALPEARRGEWGLATMRAYWVEGRDISQPDVLADIAASLGLDSEALLAEAGEPAVKDRLREYTDEAIARGVFGVPSFVVGDTLFWGNDRLVLLEDQLRAAS